MGFKDLEKKVRDYEEKKSERKKKELEENELIAVENIE